MWYVGLDVHSRQSSYCVLDENGKKLRGRLIKGPWDKLLLDLAGIKRPFSICFEASTGYGYLHERLSRMADRVVVHGDAGDVLGYSMRGGKIFVRGSAGSRVGIHMKHYEDKVPVVVIDGCVQDYLGEYMAGGLIIVLGLNSSNGGAGQYVGTGMHAGKIILRGDIETHQLGREVGIADLDDNDTAVLRSNVQEYRELFDLPEGPPPEERFVKLIPVSHRPYGKIYVY